MKKKRKNKEKKETRSENSNIIYNEYGWYTDSKGDTHFRDIEASKKFNHMLFNEEIDVDGNLL